MFGAVFSLLIEDVIREELTLQSNLAFLPTKEQNARLGRRMSSDIDDQSRSSFLDATDEMMKLVVLAVFVLRRSSLTEAELQTHRLFSCSGQTKSPHHLKS